MRLIIKLTILSILTILISSCSRHGPPEDVVRTFCENDIKRTFETSNVDGSSTMQVKVLEIMRQSLTESKNIRGIPDDVWVYTVACSLQTTIDDVDSEPETLYLYFFRDKDGGWLIRETR